MRKIFPHEKKGDIQIPFAWLFGILVGAFILFLAIFATTKLTQQQQTAIDAQTSKQIGILLDPLETGFESGTVTSIILPSETRIYNGCNNGGYFGNQRIKIAQQSLGKWTDTNVDSIFQNKYIFSESYAEGKKFFIFTKPFDFPFKVADLMYITSANDNYCFVNAPQSVQNELNNLNQENIFVDGSKTCPDSSIRVCFNGVGNCGVNVDVGGKTVAKNSTTVYFDGDSLMYAAIFSNPEIYECQLRRLMQRGGQLADLYLKKSSVISKAGCSSDLESSLLEIQSAEADANNSVKINYLAGISGNLNDKNGASGCKLW